MQGTTSCWDLAMRAIEEAAKEGYPVKHGGLTGNPYAWSSTTVAWADARPGDIMQFKGWRQQYMWAANPHTAIVVEAPAGNKCKITAYDQNPSPVHETIYDNCKKTSGAVTIYRLDELSSSRLRLFSESAALVLQGDSTLMYASLAALAALTLSMATVLACRRGALEPGSGERRAAALQLEEALEMEAVDAE